MKFFLVLGLALYSVGAISETMVTSIHSYRSEDGFMRLANGRVVFVSALPKHISTLEDREFRITLNDKSELLTIEEAGPLRSEHSLVEEIGERPPYTPSVLPSKLELEAMWNRMNGNYKRVSECTDRAHVWAYDEFKRSGFMSEKVFAFFTASYINRVRYKWWFHVAPLVRVNENGQVVSYVMDYRYSHRPNLIKEWTDSLVFSKRPCRMTTKFSEYDVNPQTEDCYMMIDSMYYRLPADLKLQETKGVYRKDFNLSEVNSARIWAFEKH